MIWPHRGSGFHLHALPFDQEGFMRAAAMRPVDGQFVHSPEVRGAVCEAAGHPVDYVNVSVSAKVGREIRMCHCGEVDEVPAALREWKKKRRQETASTVEKSQSRGSQKPSEAK